MMGVMDGVGGGCEEGIFRWDRSSSSDASKLLQGVATICQPPQILNPVAMYSSVGQQRFLARKYLWRTGIQRAGSRGDVSCAR
jgi:hypothetical protein